MKRLWAWAYDAFTRHIQVRLTVHFLLILVPLVAVSLFANIRSHQILERKTVERTKSSLLSAIDYIDLTMRNMEEISNLLTRNQAVNGWLAAAGPELSVESVVNFGELIGDLSEIVALNNLLYQVSVLHSPSDTLLSSRFGGVRLKDASLESWYRNAAYQNGFSYLHLPSENAYPIRGEYVFAKDGVYLIRSMNVYNRSAFPNFIILGIKKESLLKLIASSLPSAHTRAYLYDHDNRLVVGTDPEHAPLRPNLWEGEDEAAVTARADVPGGGETMLAVKVRSAQTHWSLVTLQPESELYKENRQLQLFTFTIIAISVVLAFWISWMVYSGIASPLKSLSFGMKQIRLGNLNVTLANRRKDELGYVTESFNQMAHDQRALIRDHYEQQLQLSKAELKFLQSQINPHFLYNTLDSIYWTAQEYEAEEIGEMVYHLSKFFRLSLQKGRDTVTVAETIEHLNHYIRVQELRFQYHFTVEYRIDEAAKRLRVLRLLLQPLAENAILHGLEKAPLGGTLTISARIEGPYLALGVEDNGVGMSADRLAYIRREIGAVTTDNTVLSPFDPNRAKDLFGLRNVVARVKIVYGDEASCRIDSAPGTGTSIVLLLPLAACEDQEADGSERQTEGGESA
ncbi:sensor histidine kinase [Paenibacillus flagellatus]|uniref:Two-component sensor histidine kinase n=1 Tax=Paenibacillus flagellatus TaxID=2211139 RepID=A0A2V5KCX1_9BACL|nr:sensor histidine kinase [Paenibacillus flagellatus]PYI57499.1 two-component sensor histidine kinase [Paenibacillus flagellatus]